MVAGGPICTLRAWMALKEAELVAAVEGDRETTAVAGGVSAARGAAAGPPQPAARIPASATAPQQRAEREGGPTRITTGTRRMAPRGGSGGAILRGRAS